MKRVTRLVMEYENAPGTYEIDGALQVGYAFESGYRQALEDAAKLWAKGEKCAGIDILSLADQEDADEADQIP